MSDVFIVRRIDGRLVGAAETEAEARELGKEYATFGLVIDRYVEGSRLDAVTRRAEAAEGDWQHIEEKYQDACRQLNSVTGNLQDALLRLNEYRKLCPSVQDLETGEQLHPESTVTVGLGYLRKLIEDRDFLNEHSPYQTCARCGEEFRTLEMTWEEGDEMECLPCNERENARERAEIQAGGVERQATETFVTCPHCKVRFSGVGGFSESFNAHIRECVVIQRDERKLLGSE